MIQLDISAFHGFPFSGSAASARGSWTTGKMRRSRSAHCRKNSETIARLEAHSIRANANQTAIGPTHAPHGMDLPCGSPSMNQRTTSDWESLLTTIQAGSSFRIHLSNSLPPLA